MNAVHRIGCPKLRNLFKIVKRSKLRSPRITISFIFITCAAWFLSPKFEYGNFAAEQQSEGIFILDSDTDPGKLQEYHSIPEKFSGGPRFWFPSQHEDMQNLEQPDEVRRESMNGGAGFLRTNSSRLGLKISKLLRSYSGRKMSNPATSSRFVLIRAIGNDLPPRHHTNQTYDNVKYILENEADMDGLDRRWHINRIVDEEKLLNILNLLITHEQVFTLDQLDHYELQSHDLRFDFTRERDLLRSRYFRYAGPAKRALMLDELRHDKILFLINNNGARNDMLDFAFQAGADYALPWDGNCFLTESAWKEIQAEITDYERTGKDQQYLYFTVPMSRLRNNDPIDQSSKPLKRDDEPQLIFYKAASERFDPSLRYGRNPKVELLLRLGIPGPWENLKPADYWDSVRTNRRLYNSSISSVQSVGWVLRLFSGQAALEKKEAYTSRGVARSEGLETILALASRTVAQNKFGYTSMMPMTYDERKLSENRRLIREGSAPSLTLLLHALFGEADEEINNGAIYTVVAKSRPPPSTDFHDYISIHPQHRQNATPASSFHPSRSTTMDADDSQFIGNESQISDRRRMASFARNVTILALAGYFSNDGRYFLKAAELLRVWFINGATRMNPNLRYAQLFMGVANNRRSHSGIVEGVTLALVWDAARLVRKAGFLNQLDYDAIVQWATEYLQFLNTAQGQDEYYAHDHHGTLFDVQSAATYAFVGDFPGLLRHTDMTRGRLLAQFENNGSMARESNGNLEFAMINAQSWIWMATIAEKIGVDIWNFRRKNDSEPIFSRGLRFLLPSVAGRNWRSKQAQNSQLIHLIINGKRKYPGFEDVVRTSVSLPTLRSIYDAEPTFEDSFPVPPYWNLAITERER